MFGFCGCIYDFIANQRIYCGSILWVYMSIFVYRFSLLECRFGRTNSTWCHQFSRFASNDNWFCSVWFMVHDAPTHILLSQFQWQFSNCIILHLSSNRIVMKASEWMSLRAVIHCICILLIDNVYVCVFLWPLSDFHDNHFEMHYIL